MRLIDADSFEAFIRRNCTDSLVDLWCELVRMQPTAYDVDKVKEKISLLQENAENNALNTDDERAAYNTAYFNAIKAVESGGRQQD